MDITDIEIYSTRQILTKFIPKCIDIIMIIIITIILYNIVTCSIIKIICFEHDSLFVILFYYIC